MPEPWWSYDYHFLNVYSVIQFCGKFGIMIDDETEIFTDLDVLYISVYADTGMYECFY